MAVPVRISREKLAQPLTQMLVSSPALREELVYRMNSGGHPATENVRLRPFTAATQSGAWSSPRRPVTTCAWQRSADAWKKDMSQPKTSDAYQANA